MSPGLLLPAALAALAALLIPLLLHLARRAETRTVVFAALRWLEPQPSARARVRLDEPMLLAVRLLLLALLALALAQPVLWNAQDRGPVTAVAPALGRAGLAPQEAAAVRAVWLAPGFPAFSAPPPASSGASLASLLRQLDAELPAGAPLEVRVPATLTEADAERPRLSRTVRWRVLADPAPPQAPPPTKPPRLIVRHVSAQQAQARWLEAAARAWAAPGAAPAYDAAGVERALPVDAGAGVVMVWLAPGPIPEPLLRHVRGGGAALLALEARGTPADAGPAAAAWRDAAGGVIVTARRLGRGRLLQLERALEPAALPALFEPHFPTDLGQLLAPAPEPAWVRAVDHAPLPGGSGAPLRPYLDLQPWAALAAAAAFVLERWLASRARGASPP